MKPPFSFLQEDRLVPLVASYGLLSCDPKPEDIKGSYQVSATMSIGNTDLVCIVTGLNRAPRILSARHTVLPHPTNHDYYLLVVTLREQSLNILT